MNNFFYDPTTNERWAPIENEWEDELPLKMSEYYIMRLCSPTSYLVKFWNGRFIELVTTYNDHSHPWKSNDESLQKKKNVYNSFRITIRSHMIYPVKVSV